MKSLLRTSIIATTALLAAALLAPAQDEKKPADPAAAFAAMLENATLKGTWAPVDKRLLGDNQEDGYHIVRATKKDGDQWEVLYRMKVQGKEIDFPLPVTVKFAGDAAVMILDNSPVGIGQTWSARILFHDDVYAGSWWSPDKQKSGIVSGTITREKAE